jgi:hypothetical protein
MFDAVVAEVAASFAKGDDFGVRGWVGVAEDAVLASADDFSVMNDDCAYGHLAGGFGGLGFGDGGAHALLVEIGGLHAISLVAG